MRRLTPELWLHSAFDADTTVVLTRELDFNLARASAIVINRIVSQMFLHLDILTGNEISGNLIQEVDVDPDNVSVEFGNSPEPNGVVIDSSRVLRHILHYSADTATGGNTNTTAPQLIKDWTHLPMEQRPISITNLRHTVRADAGLSHVWQSEVNIDYFVVELSFNELGILNASRR